MADDLLFTSASELARLVAGGKISATELLEEHLAQIRRCNPALNAIITLDEERARRRARQADEALARGELWGPLHGVPITIKDSFETADLLTTSGYPPLQEYIPTKDATAVARLKAAGAVILGKTNLPALAMDAQTNNPIFGPTNNPWNLAYNPGGSTGGGAAALAAGMTALELGSDLGGSVRIPAHSCGVFALKPTEWRVPVSGHIPPLPGTPPAEQHLNTVGPLARSVEDLALALRIIAGPDGRQLEVPPVPVGELPDLQLKSLRLAWTDQFGEHPVTRETQAAILRLVDNLTRSGCTLRRESLAEFDFAGAFDLFKQLCVAEGPERVEETSLRAYTGWMQARHAFTTAMNRVLETCDALLCPVAMRSAFQHCPSGTPLDVDGQTVRYLRGQLWYTTPFNITGNPAVALPLARSAEGLPIGLQVVGRRWEEMRLLAIAGRLTEITGQFQRPPGKFPSCFDRTRFL
jgi:amidase